MLTLSNVNKTYHDGTKALKNITVKFPTGMIGLLGPNGAGKSTLMRTIAGLQSADTGKITFNDIDVLDNPDDLRKTLGYLPQEFGVYPNMSCLALLEHMAILKGLTQAQRQQQIPELLELTNLTKSANKSVANFSGGMKQRFGIAQALLGDPKLIIMDEPTAGLDPMERERLNSVLVNISQDKLILLSTHIVEDVENLCNHVALQFNGEILVNGQIPELLAPLDGYVWESSSSLQANPIDGDGTSAHVLSQSFTYGKPNYRIYSENKPTSEATLARVTLQDRYFFELAAKVGSHAN